ncbi:MAG: CBS domain-containing protein, partial [Saprospiraceae bacterium]|nr:CBS domain-containing protein [Saprospiraceae bacterium]
VVSEIIPKTIGASSWKQLSGFTATALNWMIAPLKWTGIMWILQRLTKLFGSSHHGSVFSRADFSAVTEAASDSGALEKSESKIINNLLSLNKVFVKDIMTPRTVMITANEDTYINNFYKGNKNLRYSRIPVYSKTEDDITGYILKDELLQHLIEEDGDMPLSTLKRNLLTVKNEMALPDLFDKLTNQREHLAVVENEHGTLVGLVTMEDVIETLLGLEIMDELDNVADLQKLARQKWQERAKQRGILE